MMCSITLERHMSVLYVGCMKFLTNQFVRFMSLYKYLRSLFCSRKVKKHFLQLIIRVSGHCFAQVKSKNLFYNIQS
jgi:hypothetical protein